MKQVAVKFDISVFVIDFLCNPFSTLCAVSVRVHVYTVCPSKELPVEELFNLMDTPHAPVTHQSQENQLISESSILKK